MRHLAHDDKFARVQTNRPYLTHFAAASAEMLGVGSKTIYRYERQKRLTPVKLNSRVTRYHRSEVEKLIAEATARASTAGGNLQ
jgi:predicted DNA-binding transcriptional regulator AlpA